MQLCHCGSGLSFESCCGPYLSGAALPPTAEALMRSRYSAYLEQAIDYLGATLHPDHRGDWDRDATRDWAAQSEWLGLEILSTEAGLEGDEGGRVEFLARFNQDGVEHRHHELSEFARVGERWYYVTGDTAKPRAVRRTEPKVGRNDPCPCGSGRKYKKCCGRS